MTSSWISNVVEKSLLFPQLVSIGDAPSTQPSNPFKLSSDVEWLEFCHDEQLRKLKQRRDERHLKVHEKHTHRSRHVGDSLPSLKNFLKEIDEEIDQDLQAQKRTMKGSSIEALPLRIRPIIKEASYDLKTRKRDMFLIKYSLRIKQNEIEQYNIRESQEEKKIKKLSEQLRKDADLFDEFLKSTDQSAAKAVKEAEVETKLKVEKAVELRRLQVTFSVVCADITKKDELLTEYLNYKSFLLLFNHNYNKNSGEDFTIAGWAERRRNLNAKRSGRPITCSLAVPKQRTHDVSKKRSLLPPMKKSDTSVSTQSVRSTVKVKKKNESGKFDIETLPSKLSFPEEWEEDSQDFSEKIQYLLDDPLFIVKEIQAKEDETVKLLYRMQDHQDSLEEQKSIHKEKVFKKDLELKRLVDLVTIIEISIESITKKYEELKINCKLLGIEEKGNVEEATNILTQNIEKVYRCIFNRMLVRLDGLAMLSCIEKRLDQLLDEVESLPENTVKQLQKFKDKERRLAQREEKLLLQKIKQEERVRKALERSNKLNLRNNGRKLIFRSAPPAARFTSNVSHETAVESESIIFFSSD